MKPIRIQRRRTLGWRKPPDTRIVDRSTAFGNPFRAAAPTPEAHAEAVGLFRRWLAGADFPGPLYFAPSIVGALLWPGLFSLIRLPLRPRADPDAV